MCYTIRELYRAKKWPIPKSSSERGMCRKIKVTSHGYNAGLVIDRGVTLPFNEGTIAVFEIHPKDTFLAATTVIAAYKIYLRIRGETLIRREESRDRAPDQGKIEKERRKGIREVKGDGKEEMGHRFASLKTKKPDKWKWRSKVWDIVGTGDCQANEFEVLPFYTSTCPRPATNELPGVLF
uniref:Uncharacterized protein n=1 Tax=Vespula pensylvanica TaxID=30213 RepID=A0A834U9I7_VESPE|nr:hypothetical protein H0235_009085 [Vespula pensylvanica]